jgi:hypothetical protein
VTSCSGNCIKLIEFLIDPFAVLFSVRGGVPALATTTFGSGSGLLLPLLSGQMESNIVLSL